MKGPLELIYLLFPQLVHSSLSFQKNVPEYNEEIEERGEDD